MRWWTAGFVIAAAALLVAGCGADNSEFVKACDDALQQPLKGSGWYYSRGKVTDTQRDVEVADYEKFQNTVLAQRPAALKEMTDRERKELQADLRSLESSGRKPVEFTKTIRYSVVAGAQVYEEEGSCIFVDASENPDARHAGRWDVLFQGAYPRY